MRSLKFIPGSVGLGPIQHEFDSDLARELSLFKAQGVCAAYVVRASDLATFRRLGDLIVDRRTKSHAKGLSATLLGQKKIPLIESSYDSAGRLEQGVAALLRRACDCEDRNIYLIGTGETLFAEMWKRTAAKSARTRRRATGRKTAFIPRDGRLASQYLLELLPHEDIPPELDQTYIGISVEAHLVRHLIVRAARSDEPVLILGPTGTGKEVVARAIHKFSRRSGHQFVAVNCAAIPRELLEAELFGSTRGVATGVTTRAGLWELTQRGTLFLDEIGDLSLEHQAKILRALQEGTIRRIGEAREREVHARIVAATNRDLFTQVRAGLFREDLYYRLRALTIRTPTLRDHAEDVPLIARFLWRKITRDADALLPDEIVARLSRYRWPGNVREMKAVLTNVLTLFGRHGLGEEHLDAVFHLEGHDGRAEAETTHADEVALHRIESLRHLRRVDEVIRAAMIAAAPVTDRVKPVEKPLLESVDALMRQHIGEMELLCLRPLLFHSEVAFEIVHRLKGKLAYFQTLLIPDTRTAQRFWRAEAGPDCRLALSAVFEEVRRLTA